MDTDEPIEIDELKPGDLSRGFLDSLLNLSEVGLSADEALPLLQERIRNGIRTYVARRAGQVLGTASLVIERKFIHRGGLAGHIEDVAVHRDHQKKGIGAALVRHATEEARRLGCYKVILDCSQDRVGFYERLGYRAHEVGMRIDL